MRIQVLGHLVAGTLACSVSSAQAQSFFQGLGDLSGGGTVRSKAFGISADGATVVGEAMNAAGGLEAFRWTQAGGMVGLGYLQGGGAFSRAMDASADGAVIVGKSDASSGGLSFRWTAQTGMVGLGVPASGATSSVANAVSGDGSVIIGTVSLQAYRWTQATGMVELGYLPGASLDFSRGKDVSLDGQVAATPSYSACTGGAYEPARWTTAGGMQGLGGLPGQRCIGFAYGVSPDGSAIVGWTYPVNSPTHAFLWKAQTGMVSLGTTPPGATGNGAVANNGEVVVGDMYSSTDQVFIWRTAVGMRGLQSVLKNEYGLNLVGWRLFEARGISSDGRTIVGIGSNPAGEREGWIAHLGDPCYADCDQSTGIGVLDIFDFLCWQGHFVIGNAYACDCDISTGPGVCDVFDFLCFQNAFVGGCP